MSSDKSIFEIIEDLQKAGETTVPTDSERQEIAEIDELRRIVLDIQSTSDCQYYSST